MPKATAEERIRAVLLYIERSKRIDEISTITSVSSRTVWRWIRAYRKDGADGLKIRKPGAAHPTNSSPKKLEERVLALKQKHPSWGARRLKYQYELPCHWITVHRMIKRHNLLIRIKAKPQPSKRFQRRYVDSMWQGDSFQFRITNVGKVYVIGFIDDRSRFRVASGAYTFTRV